MQFASLSGAVIAVGGALKASVDSTVEYANQVRSLSMISGETTENTSRFLQVLDDYKISADDAMVATRALTKEGLTPSIDTLARLSDQYLSLTDAQTRNEFVLKNLGRAGLQWVEVLGKGGDAIRAQGAAVSSQLILTQKAVQEARNYELAMDDWADAVQGVKIAVGNALIPAVVNLNNAMKDEERGLEILRESYSDWELRMMSLTPKGRELIENAREQAAAEREAAKAAQLNARALDDQGASALASADALKELERANASSINLAIDLTSTNRDYVKSQQDIQAEQTDLKKQMEELYPWELDKLNELQGKYDELSGKYAENAAAHEERKNRILLDLTLEKIAMADGVAGFSEAEAAKALAVADTLGAVEGAAVREQIAFDTVSTAVANGTIPVQDMKGWMDSLATVGPEDAARVAQGWGVSQAQMRDEADATSQKIAGVVNAVNSIPTSKTINIGVNVSGLDALQGLRDTLGDSQAANPGRTYRVGGRAAGGPVMAGYPYVVGEKGPEMFVPQQSGNIIPNGKLQQNDNQVQIAALIASMPSAKAIGKETALALMRYGAAR